MIFYWKKFVNFFLHLILSHTKLCIEIYTNSTKLKNFKLINLDIYLNIRNIKKNNFFSYLSFLLLFQIHVYTWYGFRWPWLIWNRFPLPSKGDVLYFKNNTFLILSSIFFFYLLSIRVIVIFLKSAEP